MRNRSNKNSEKEIRWDNQIRKSNISFPGKRENWIQNEWIMIINKVERLQKVHKPLYIYLANIYL